MKPTHWLILFLVIVAGTVLGNLIVAKIVSVQVQSSANATPLGRLLGSLG